MLFCESGQPEALFAEIEKIIGMSIEKMVIESKRRVTKEYLEKMIPAPVAQAHIPFKPGLIAEKMAVIGKAHGYGKIEMVEIKTHRQGGFPEDDHRAPPIPSASSAATTWEGWKLPPGGSARSRKRR